MYKHGLILGKFMPLHLGHMRLIDHGIAICEQLTIVVDVLDGPYSTTQRREWIKASYPRARVLTVSRAMPQNPADAANFWEQWKAELQQHQGDRPFDCLLAGEGYGYKLANTLNIAFFPVDRGQLPIAASSLRPAINEQWLNLAPAVRHSLCTRISVFGPESTGKTTLAKNLGERFNIPVVAEYAREFLEFNHGSLQADSLVSLSCIQRLREDAAAACSPVIICDTDPLATVVWNQTLGQQSNTEQLNAIASRSQYPLTLLTDVDTPWIDDIARYFPEQHERQSFLDDCIKVLERSERLFTKISGSWEQRWTTAESAVMNILNERSLPYGLGQPNNKLFQQARS